MTESERSKSAGMVSLICGQVPLMLRAFFRQKGLVLWTYGFSVLALVLACGVLSAGEDSVQESLGCAVIAMTIVCTGLYGVSQGLWDHFGGTTFESVNRSRFGISAVVAFCIARFAVVYSAALLQLVLLTIFLGQMAPFQFLVLIVLVGFATASLVALGLFCAAVVRTQRQTVILANTLFALLVVLGVFGTVNTVQLMPEWAKVVGKALPSWHALKALQGGLIEGELVGKGGMAWVAWELLYFVVCTVVLSVVSVARLDWLALDQGNTSRLNGA